MTPLAKFKAANNRALAAAVIKEFSPVQVYFLNRQRNAWHSTWISRYSDRSMHTDLQSAKDEAELSREIGAVFRIEQQPALCIATEKGSLIITEINSQLPLGELALPGALQRGEMEYKDYINELCGERNSSVRTFVKGLLNASLWRKNPDNLDDILVLRCSAATHVEPCRKTWFKEWKSFSPGAAYKLGWAEGRTRTKGRAIRKVSALLTASLCVGERAEPREFDSLAGML